MGQWLAWLISILSWHPRGSIEAPFIYLVADRMLGLGVPHINALSLLWWCLFFLETSLVFSSCSLKIPKSNKKEKAPMSKYLLISHFLLSCGQRKSHGQAQRQSEKGMCNWGLITTIVNHTLESLPGGCNSFWKSSVWCDRSETWGSTMR